MSDDRPHVEIPSEVEIRALRADEADKLVACIRRCYGDSYIDPTQYDASLIAQAVRERRRHSVVAVDAANEVVGHMGITLRRQGDNTADAGMTLVDPRYRGRQISRQLGLALGHLGQTLGLVGMHDYPVTVHGATQRIGAEFGTDTGLLLANMPADVRFEEMDAQPASAPLRSASLVRYLPLGEAPGREIYAPARYAALLAELASHAGLRRRIHTRDRIASDAESQLDAYDDARRSVLRIEVAHIGSSLLDRVRGLLEERGEFQPVATHLDLPLHDEAAPHAAETLRSLGFHYGGFLPEYRDGDVLRLQRVMEPSGTAAAPVLEFEAGRALGDFVLRDAATLGSESSPPSSPD